MWMSSTSPKVPPTLPPLQHDVVVLHKGFGPGGIDVYTLDQLAHRQLPLWRRIWMRLRRR